MAAETGINWCDSTLNPWVGCQKVSPGCDSCYAESWAKRSGLVKWGPGEPRRRTSAANWREPVKWNVQPFGQCVDCGWRGEMRHAVQSAPVTCPRCLTGEIISARRRVFCASLADVFDNEVPIEWRADLFDLIDETPNLDWLLLTKRVGNVERFMPVMGLPLNVWLGATIVNQEEADRDIPKLLAVPARVRFLSCEPLLGPVDLVNIRRPDLGDGREYAGADVLAEANRELRGCIDWVIVGGESGPHARDFDIHWPRAIVAQCKAAGVPAFVKQMGAKPVWSEQDDGIAEPPFWGRIKYLDRSGGDWSEWPEDLRVREFPNA